MCYTLLEFNKKSFNNNFSYMCKETFGDALHITLLRNKTYFIKLNLIM